MQRQSCHNSHATTIMPGQSCHHSYAKTVRPAVPRQTYAKHAWQMPRAYTLNALTHARVPCSCETISMMYLQSPSADLWLPYAGICDDLAAAVLGQSRGPLGHIWCCKAANLCLDQFTSSACSLADGCTSSTSVTQAYRASPLTASGTLQERTCTHKLYRHSSVTSRPPPAEC